MSTAYGTAHDIGQWVEVSGEDLDDVGLECHGDLIGQRGQVYLIDFNHGCGENEDGIDGENTDPMFHVGFPDGKMGSFFFEELLQVDGPEEVSGE